LSVKQILRWADAYHERHGSWPTRNSGSITEQDGETWAMIDRALARQRRGLHRKSSLYRLLKEHRRAVRQRPSDHGRRKTKSSASRSRASERVGSSGGTRKRR